MTLLPLTMEQHCYFQQYCDALEVCLGCRDDNDMLRKTRPFELQGLPGSGKTYLAMFFVVHALRSGARVLVATPAALQGGPYRKLIGVSQGNGRLTIRTAHKAFNFPLDSSQQWWDLPDVMPYDVVLVDEMSQLTSKAFTQIIRIWLDHGRRYVLLFSGDFQQISCIDKNVKVPQNATKSTYWNLCIHHCLREPSLRVKDPKLVQFLRTIRMSPPTYQDLEELTADRIYKATNETLIREAVNAFFNEFSNGIFLTVTKKGCRIINEQAASLRGATCFGQFALWEDDQLVSHRLYKNMPIMLTRNLDENQGLVNGALGTLLDVRNNCLLIRLDDDRMRMVWPVTDRRSLCTRLMKTGFCVVPAYACTIHKVQGATLPAACVWFETCRGIFIGPGLGYVACSRVSGLDRLRFLGDVQIDAFTPVSND